MHNLPYTSRVSAVVFIPLDEIVKPNLRSTENVQRAVQHAVSEPSLDGNSLQTVDIDGLEDVL